MSLSDLRDSGKQYSQAPVLGKHPISPVDGEIFDQIVEILKERRMPDLVTILNRYKMVADTEVLMQLRSFETHGEDEVKESGGGENIFIRIDDDFGTHILYAKMMLTMSTKDAFEDINERFYILFNGRTQQGFYKGLEEYILKFRTAESRDNAVQEIEYKLSQNNIKIV